MEKLFDKFESLVEAAVTDFEGARNITTKADALLLLKETLITANMYGDYSMKRKAAEENNKKE